MTEDRQVISMNRDLKVSSKEEVTFLIMDINVKGKAS